MQSRPNCKILRISRVALPAAGTGHVYTGLCVQLHLGGRD